jgi:uncharacterized membrane protein
MIFKRKNSPYPLGRILGFVAVVLAATFLSVLFLYMMDSLFTSSNPIHQFSRIVKMPLTYQEEQLRTDYVNGTMRIMAIFPLSHIT